MASEEYCYLIKIGNSRRKVESLNMVLGKPSCRGADNDWVIECEISGFYCESKNIEARSAFDCLVCGIAYLRQTLRLVMANNPKSKLFFEFEGSLDEMTIEDIFMTHDCITDEMEEMVMWAKDNGFEPE